jgi:hypothetical protein
VASRSRARERDQSVTIAANGRAALSRPGAHGTPGVAARVETSIRTLGARCSDAKATDQTGLRPGRLGVELCSTPSLRGFPGGIQIEALVL